MSTAVSRWLSDSSIWNAPDQTLSLIPCAFALEIARDVVERALKPLADLLDLVGLDHQRRREYQPIADHAQNKAVTFGCSVHPRAHIERGRERNAPLTVAH